MPGAVRRSPVARVLCAALAACAATAAACGGPEAAPAPPTTPRTLAATPESISVPPGGMGTLGFVLLGPTGEPLPGAVVTFAIVDDPTAPSAKAQGAALATASATTDAQGRCAAHVTAGLAAVFRVRATSANAQVDVVVVVAAGDVGSVDVAPFFPAPAGAHAAAVATTIEILFFDNSSCGDIDVRDPPQPVRTMRSVPASGAVARYDFVSTAVGYAIVGRARDGRGVVRALGCTDLQGRALVAGSAVQIALPLVDVGPDPAGMYTATTSLAIAPPLAAATTLAAAWRDLTDCPLDPAQLWIDCTIDALGPGNGGDPLDCVPATAPGADGPVGDALGALRGAPLAGPSGAPTLCRGTQTAGGATSIDAVVQGMFGSPVPAALVGLAAAAADASHLFDDLRLGSTLDVRAAGTLTDVTITHTLTSVGFALSNAMTDVALQPLGLPVLTATTTGVVSEDMLTLARHGFTVRLGAAARAAFGVLALERRGLPADAPGLVAGVAALAHGEDGKLSGCAALDEALCARAGRAAGCLVTACAAGLEALGARLDASFEAANGTDLDLYLEGAAPLLETHDDGLAGRLGDLQPGAQAATWSVDLRPRDGRRALSAPWEAVRSGN
ncbi:MAG TPA: hypothetical protein VGK52_02555 [Polyangia bacterium]